ncbi:MAG: FAD-dependent oxidoreductase, partial [Paracoccaceae bacterium]
LLAGPRLQIATARGIGEISASLVLLATGVRETSRAARLLGGTKPAGVITTGTLQSMVYLDRSRPFRHPVILGTELVSFSAIMTCRHLGIQPVGMIEPSNRATARWPASQFPRLTGVPLHLDTECRSIQGRDTVTGVTVKNANKTHTIDCDGVIVSGKFRPDAPLLHTSKLEYDPASGGPVVDQYGRCSDPDYFAAGNLLRAVETAGWSWNEGRQMANIMAAALKGSLPDTRALSIKTDSKALGYCVPQTLSPPCGVTPLPSIQLRVNRPFRGRVALLADGKEVVARSINTLPERRILLTCPDIPGGSEFELRMEENAS